MNKDQIAIVTNAFVDHVDWNDLYLFYDSHVEGGEDFRGQQISLSAQLVSIGTKGIPMHVSRGHWQLPLSAMRRIAEAK